MTITSERKYEQLKIRFNGKLHLQIKLLDLIGFQSWIHGTNEHFIEYYFQGSNKITTVYGTRDKWEAILDILDSEISVTN